MSVKTTFLENDGREWYHIEGTEYGTGYDLNSDYAIDGDTVLDIDGCPLTDGNNETIAVRNALENKRKSNGDHAITGKAWPSKSISRAASALGKMGGSKTSDAKKKSSAENGKKGGRPRR